MRAGSNPEGGREGGERLGTNPAFRLRQAEAEGGGANTELAPVTMGMVERGGGAVERRGVQAMGG